MEELLREIIEDLRDLCAKTAGVTTVTDDASNSNTSKDASIPTLDTKRLLQIIRKHNEGRGTPDAPPFAKKQLLPYYLRIKETDSARWESWHIDTTLERALVATLRMKPRRTASGVATITVLTKPWPCAGGCVYCPNDVRMPKSYLADEPACQRAERNYFDPYLQVAGRLFALEEMGHVTDKVELIILGGTWSEYPLTYQRWFIRELFCALNEEKQVRAAKVKERRDFYHTCGLSQEVSDLQAFVADTQARIDAEELTYNQAISELYGKNEAWTRASATQTATLDEIYEAQHTNENAHNRCVGLVIETRPDAINTEELFRLRQYGCTKIQMGIQSLDAQVLQKNCRTTKVDDIIRAFALLRLFGFKTHVHAMVNLYGSISQKDKADYARLVNEPNFIPDEIKLYPCVLVKSAALCALAQTRDWKAYTEDKLVDVLVDDVLITPAYTRISRMIRDISAHDIIAGNKKTNLRQAVEELAETRARSQDLIISEIRHREIASRDGDTSELTLKVTPYQTSVTKEYFLEWVTPQNQIAGFLRLSLPDKDYVCMHIDELPIHENEAMIREVHVYGRVASLHGSGQNAQHTGLGRRLIEKACEIALAHQYIHINVISAIGTRKYYENLGFSITENALYMRKVLCDNA